MTTGLMPISVTDPAGLVTRATYDYRVLQPAELIDANGNHTLLRLHASGTPGK